MKQSWKKVFALTLVLTMMITSLLVLPAATMAVPLYDTIQGFRWKPEVPSRDAVKSCIPDLGQSDPLRPYPTDPRKSVCYTTATTSHETAATGKVDDFVQYATIDITPKNKLIKCDPDGVTGLCLTNSEANTWKANQYTAIANFIDSVKTNNIQFILHARVNDQTEFTDDMIATINEIKALGNGNKVKGIMIGEHEMSNPVNYLNMALEIADDINANTSDFLKNGKGLSLHGGRFGADFTGIKNALASTLFISKMAGKVDHFAFDFKFFDANNTLKPASGSYTSQSNWENYLKIDLGLNELKNGLDLYKSAYPNHTSVIFVGDSADGVGNIVRRTDPTNSSVVIGPTIIDAIQNVFKLKGWKGFVFGMPFDAGDRVTPTPPATDMGGIWTYNGTTFTNQQAYTWWQDWKTVMTTP